MVVRQLHRSPEQGLLTASGGPSVLEFIAPPLETLNQSKTFFFGTKAETLASLQPLVKTAEVPNLLYFSVLEWSTDAATVLLEITRRFDGSQVVFRSSALNEDGDCHSQAGAFTSCLDIDSGNPQAVQKAVQAVLNSFEGGPEDQVLVMPMLKDVTLSGVIMTHELDTGAPYYILNYDDESGKTDTITGGTGVNKTVMVHRDFASGHVDSLRVAELLNLARELEGLCDRGTPLDIEFAKTADGRLHLLQVRRITVKDNWNRRNARHVGEALYQAEQFFAHHNQPKPHVAGNRTILGQMPDWNPAEIIGTHPKPLAVSIYRYLITDSVWQEARETMGYQPVPHTPLMITLGGQPYVDVRASFNSFLPTNLPANIRTKLVNSWLSRLEAHPEFHDKVEFDVVQTVVDFNFDRDFLSRYHGSLDGDEYQEYRSKLAQLTEKNISLETDASLPCALRQVEKLAALQAPYSDNKLDHRLENLPILLEECRDLGTQPFSIIARHAFIAEALLRSAVSCHALSTDRLGALKQSLHTITTDFTSDFTDALSQPETRDKFLKKYGHLRPGTYDITSPRYDQRVDLFEASANSDLDTKKASFSLTNSERQTLKQLFLDSSMGSVDPDQFIEYARLAITHREGAKFIFTRHLSRVLELIAAWGETHDLDREALAQLNVSELLDELVNPVLTDPEIHFQDLIEYRRREQEHVSGIRLGYLIRDPRDLYVVPLHRSAPNFVTDQRIEGVPLRLDNQARGNCELQGRIICIENADPGFDWIFTRDIAGLVSKFGGANSHMTIRCAELGLPAAIGVGEQTFERVATSECMELDGKAHIIRPIYG